MRTLALVALVAALSACATPNSETATSEPRDCFRAADVSGYGIIDSDRVRVRIGPSREYYLTVQGGTRDLRFDETLGIDAGHSFVCTGNGLGVRVIGGDHDFPRPVTLIERAPPRETAAATETPPTTPN
jgi:Family of unknown function (DUF6491)